MQTAHAYSDPSPRQRSVRLSHHLNGGNTAMTTGHIKPDLIVDHPISSRLVTAATELCLSVLRAIARIIRIRRDRARLWELPDYLLRDIGINRSEIQSSPGSATGTPVAVGPKPSTGRESAARSPRHRQDFINWLKTSNRRYRAAVLSRSSPTRTPARRRSPKSCCCSVAPSSLPARSRPRRTASRPGRTG
ncbi:DUF1127 domain-containing protein [Mesorhizobium sp. B2-2-2]|nr:DUF1127 domain-containing protein [Mesorhizobium sp. B2-2-2]